MSTPSQRQQVVERLRYFHDRVQRVSCMPYEKAFYDKLYEDEKQVFTDAISLLTEDAEDTKRKPNWYDKLEAVCSQDCTCPQFVHADRTTWRHCDRCNAATILNDFAETANDYFDEIAARATKDTHE